MAGIGIYVRIGIAAFLIGLGFYLDHRIYYIPYKRGIEAAAAKQSAEAKATTDLWESRVKAAQEVNDANQKLIADLKRQPVPTVLCRRASPVPQSPASAPVNSPATGNVPPAASPDFDPTERLAALADAADQIVESCRVLRDSWPK